MSAIRNPDFRDLPKRPDLEQTMLQVESLGISCELGLVQRHCGAEPLGLLRFGYTPLSGLIAAMEADFAGVEEFSLIARNDWMTLNERYGMEFHTGHKPDRDAGEVKALVARHLTFLARKLMDDLRDGQKLFVFRPETPSPTGEDAANLLRAMRRFGRAPLLWVTTTDDPEMVGTAKWTVPGEIMTGYLDRYAAIRFAAGASLDAWINIVSSALALRRS